MQGFRDDKSQGNFYPISTAEDSIIFEFSCFLFIRASHDYKKSYLDTKKVFKTIYKDIFHDDHQMMK